MINVGNTFCGILLLHKPTVKFRVEIFKEYAAKRKESVWTQLLTLLNRPVGFIMNMTARVIAKMACWSRDLMQGADLQVHIKLKRNTIIAYRKQKFSSQKEKMAHPFFSIIILLQTSICKHAFT